MHWRNLPEALGLAGRELVSFVGGGGKTTALFALARHTTRTTVITTTTKMGRDRTGGVELLVKPRQILRLDRVPERAGLPLVHRRCLRAAGHDDDQDEDP